MNFINYTYIILDESSRKAAIVDPAWELDTIEEKLKEINGVAECILLTHSHFDHTNQVEHLVQKYDVDVYMCKEEIDFYDFTCSNLIAIEDQEIIKLGETYISCIYTPGHTAGSMCYLTNNNLFTGDTIFIEGCGMCFGTGASAREMFHSVQKIKRIIKNSTLIYPSHSYGIVPGCNATTLMQYNIYFHLDSIDKFIEFRMRKKQSNLFTFK